MAVDFNGVVDDVNDYTIFMVADFRGAAFDQTDGLSGGLSGGGSCFTAIDANGNTWGLETLYLENDLFFTITDGEYDICSILSVPDKPAIVSVLSEGGLADDLVLNVNGNQERLSGFSKKDALKGLSLGALRDSAQEGESRDFGYFSGDIAEFIVFKRALTEDEQQRITAYLSEKWGIQPSP